MAVLDDTLRQLAYQDDLDVLRGEEPKHLAREIMDGLDESNRLKLAEYRAAQDDLGQLWYVEQITTTEPA